MHPSLTLLFALAGVTCAADTIDFFFPAGSEGVDPVATIKTANPSTTEFRLSCPTGAASDDCGWGPGLDYTILSKTKYQAQMSAGSFSMSFGCDHNTVKSEMVCGVYMSGQDFGLSVGTQLATLSKDDIIFNTATVVQGASLLSSADASGTGAASVAPKTTAASSPTNTGLKTSATTPNSAAASGAASTAGQASQTASGSAAPAQHTGAAVKFGIDGSALLLLAGVAAVHMF